jgi:AraC-like DNA-binding protein
MPYKNFEPLPSLTSYIKCFWYAERQFSGDAGTFEIMPDGYVELVFFFPESTVFYLKGDDCRELPTVFVVGLLDSPIRIKTSGMLKTIGIRFYPWAFYDTFNSSRPMSENILQHPTLRTIRGILPENYDSSRLDEYINSIQDFLVNVLPENSEYDKVRIVSETLTKQMGLVKIQTLAEKQFVSPRQLGRLFNARVGVSPKELASLIRFENIRDRIYEHPAINLTQLAYEFNYADQSHFIADFKRFSGKSPGAFAKEMASLKREFSAYNVRFSQ